MSRETIHERVRVIRRLLERSPSYQLHDVPWPRPSQVEPLRAVDLARALETLRQQVERGELAEHYLNLYLHVPLCRSRCTYCMYPSRVTRGVGRGAPYVRFLTRQLDYFAPALAGLAVQNLHVGGGTPTLLDDRELAELHAAVGRSCRLAAGGSRVIETNPENVSAAKAELLVRLGFNKVSVGVQSLDREVLSRHGRGHQTEEHVRQALAHLRRAGAPYVNCDFMLGLAGDCAATFLAGLERLMVLGPDTIMLSKLQPPWGYLRRHFGGRSADFERAFDVEFRRAIEPMLTLGERHGYRTDSPDASEIGWRFWRRDFQPPYDARRPYYCTGGETPSSTVGLGHFARSRIWGQLCCESRCRTLDFDPASPALHGRAIDRHYEETRWVVGQLCSHARLDFAAFRRQFGRPLEEAFPGRLPWLAELALARSTPAGLELANGSSQDRYLVTRLFLDQRAVLDELALADSQEFCLELPGRRWLFRVEHHRPARQGYLAKAHHLGLRLAGPADTKGASHGLVLDLVVKLFGRTVRWRPELAAEEVAGRICAEVGALLAPELRVVARLEPPRSATPGSPAEPPARQRAATRPTVA